MKWQLIFLSVFLLKFVCAENIDPAIPCHNTADCQGYSRILKDAFCKDGFCACKNGSEIRNCSSISLIPHDNRNAGPLVYRSCKRDQDCPFRRGFCNTTISQCECQKDYVPSSNKQQCLEKAQSIDFPCIDEKQCLAFLPNTTCRNGECACATGYHFTDNACYKIADFGGPCGKTQECSYIEGAICNDRNICACPAETIINMDRKRCLPVARNIEDNCTESVQCSMTFSDSLCIDKTCQCGHEYHFEHELNACVVSKGLDENCGNSFECYQTEDRNETQSEKAIECVSNKCACAENYYKDQDRCVNAAVQFVSSNLQFIVLPVFIYVSSFWQV